jgi:hypothetical protein
VLSWSKDHPHLMIGTTKGAVLVFDTANKRVLHNIPGVHEEVQSLKSVSPEQRARARLL